MIRIIAIILMVGYGVVAFGQTENPEVLYDPLFWKDDLKLKNEQCSEINAVNHEYYERILDTYEEVADDRQALNRAIVQCSRDRSHQIWEIFSPKQRKRWTKLWSERYSGNNG